MHVLTEEASLAENLALAGERTVRLGRSIVITQALTIPAGVEFRPGQHMLIKGGPAATIRMDGELVAGRHQVFDGFQPGDITGTFGSGVAIPEWWGMVPDHNDIAINCAVQASPRGGAGIMVRLAGITYRLSSNIDCRGTAVRLEGVGHAKTTLLTIPGWKPAKWEHTNAWPEQADGNHAAVVWVGGDAPGANSFFTNIRGIGINAYAASVGNPTKYVSGISATAWVEEASIIDDIGVHWASGTCVGFPQHRAADGVHPPATVNGLRCTNFWFTGPMKRDSLPIYTTHWANNCYFGTGTIDMSLLQQVSAAWESGGYAKPPYIQDWPLVGMRLQGKTKVDQIHVEGCGVAAWVPNGDSINTITIDGLDCSRMMCRAAGQIYTADGKHPVFPPIDNIDFWGYSTGVLIAREGEICYMPGQSPKDRVKIDSFASNGGLCYALRDDCYKLHLSTWGQGQFPLEPTGGITMYARGNAYRLPAESPNNYLLIR